MPKRLALLGAAQGPCVSTRGIATPHLKVAGLPEGGKISVKLSNGETLEIPANGVHSLGTGIAWIEVSCDVKGRHMTVCEVTSKAA